MNFITIKVFCSQEMNDVLIAELFELGFDAFQELDDGFEGSCPQETFDEEAVRSVIQQYPSLSFEIKPQEKVNWNEEWEKNYDPIVVENRCLVRASFHPPQPEFDYEIIVTPKMSFGTGHHATTYQVLAYQMQVDHQNKKVLDVGTGTGILAIMAAKRGAGKIVATDIDDWCIENSRENFSLNNAGQIVLKQGQIDVVTDNDFDLIIANINKNVLLDQMGAYASRLKKGGQLILSGFYEDDLSDLVQKGAAFDLSEATHSVRDRWAMLVLDKRSV